MTKSKRRHPERDFTPTHPNAATLEPIGQLLQIAGAGPEGANRLSVPVRRNGRDVHPRADIDRCGMRMGGAEVSLGIAAL